jgi:hypothetical protein
MLLDDIDRLTTQTEKLITTIEEPTAPTAQRPWWAKAAQA